TLIHFVWQACAIALPVGLLLRLTARGSANTRYLIACAGLSAMVAAPLVTGRVLVSESDGLSGDRDAAIASVFVASAPRVGRSPDTRVPSIADVVRTTAAGARVPPMSVPDLDRAAPAITIVWLGCVAL